VITPEQEEMMRQHFRRLPWLEFLADMYLCVEALGSEAVKNIVPLADPGTHESLPVPLSDNKITSLSGSTACGRNWPTSRPRYARHLLQTFRHASTGSPRHFTAWGSMSHTC
jgi:hypothetical protein